MPVASILSCRHVFHAECLEQATTSKACKNDPPCPLCVRLEQEGPPEERVFSRLRNDFPRIRPFSEGESSWSWACVPRGDFVKGQHNNNTMLLLNRNRVKKNLSLKSNNCSKEFPGKLRNNNSLYTLPLLGGNSADPGQIVCSDTKAGPSLKR
ncbi:hypothetical protein Tsubulata_039737 [Turnera subulata]|uniref:RING-type domain-containing protein n=1 Tax=Turnera subulata TaxID=218843 RepID=A0A9Q0FGJ1_9ROSI|nr:hypothetical protein Tsubulata_039737 [Turnera subulata]